MEFLNDLYFVMILAASLAVVSVFLFLVCVIIINFYVMHVKEKRASKDFYNECLHPNIGIVQGEFGNYKFCKSCSKIIK